MIGRRSLLLGTVCLAVLSACGKTQGVVVRDAWSPIAPPGAAVIAVYGEIAATTDDVLLHIATPAAESAELHSMSEENGMMKMRMVENLVIKSGSPVQLAPGGMHVMLMGIHEPLAVGAQIPLTFQFKHAGDVAVIAQVR